MTVRSALPPVVCFSNLDWGYLRYRKQHLMARLGRRCPVVYVNPPRAAKWRHLGRAQRFSTPEPGVLVFEPPVLPGIRRHATLREWNYRVIARMIRARLEVDRRRVVWLYSPHALGFITLLDADFVVYDIADDYTVPSGRHVRNDDERHELTQLSRLEPQVLRRANLILCVSEPLMAKARAAGCDAVLVPNGCDIDRHPDPPAAGPAPTRPRIGYVGTIAPRIDLDLIAQVAAARPDWDVVLVGPVTPGTTVPAHLPPNLSLAGAVAYEQVPAMIASFDVAVLPLKEIPFAVKSSPIQVYDYLAAGKAVVSTPVTQFEHLGDLIRIASGPAEFISAVETALQERTEAHVRARRSFARANSWEARVDQIAGLIDV